MIYHCDVCNEDRYIPGECVDPICPECKVSRTRDNVQELALKKVKELGPKIREQCGEGASYAEIALTPLGREYVGWAMVLSPNTHKSKRVRVSDRAKLTVLPRELANLIRRIGTFDARDVGGIAWVELSCDNFDFILRIKKSFYRLIFEECT